MVLQKRDVGMLLHGFDKPALNLKTRVVGMVEDAKFRVTSFAVKVEIAVFLAVKIHAPLHQAAYAFGSALHHLLYGAAVADVVAGNEGVGDMLLEIVHFKVGHRSHAALGLGRISLFDVGLAYQGHSASAALGDLQGITHSGHAGTDYEKVKFANHCLDTPLYIYTRARNERRAREMLSVIASVPPPICGR